MIIAICVCQNITEYELLTVSDSAVTSVDIQLARSHSCFFFLLLLFLFSPFQTPSPFREIFPNDDGEGAREALDDHVYADAMAFGMGNCCLQVTACRTMLLCYWCVRVCVFYAAQCLVSASYDTYCTSHFVSFCLPLSLCFFLPLFLSLCVSD